MGFLPLQPSQPVISRITCIAIKAILYKIHLRLDLKYIAICHRIEKIGFVSLCDITLIEVLLIDRFGSSMHQINYFGPNTHWQVVNK